MAVEIRDHFTILYLYPSSVAGQYCESRSSECRQRWTRSTARNCFGTAAWSARAFGNAIRRHYCPYFGNPMSPYVGGMAQAEVWNILATLSKVHDAAFVSGFILPPITPAEHPLHLGGVVFDRCTNIALTFAKSEIQSLSEPQYAAACPALSAIPIGGVICDLIIKFSACSFCVRLRKSESRADLRPTA